MQTPNRTAVFLATALGVLPMSGHPQTYYVEQQAAATGLCKAATSDAAKSLRFRPLGIFNAGSIPVDLSCAIRSTGSDSYTLGTHFHNYASQPQSVTCVHMVGNRESGGASGSRMTSTEVPARGSARMSSELYSFGWNEFHTLSCRIAPGMEMGVVSARQFCYYGC
ncbi:hypothetical protein GCM10028862_18170 [Luteimonas pelagia]